jgi:purine-nucleoside phosphorylase
MTDYYKKLETAMAFIKQKTDVKPEIAVVLGSGLGNFVNQVDVKTSILYSEIEGFPVSTAPGHKGQFIFGEVGGKKVVLMQGRVHYYEGYDVRDVVMPIRLMRMMGAEKIILTNAAGAVNVAYNPGEFMLISDQICLAPSPLIGANINELGERFTSMANIFDSDLRKIVRQTAADAGIGLREGVYIQTTGPQYETAAEIRMYRNWGADAVGMSTAVEAIAAVHCGLRVTGISCITNMACGVTAKPPSEQEVLEEAAKAEPRFQKLISTVIQNI